MLYTTYVTLSHNSWGALLHELKVDKAEVTTHAELHKYRRTVDRSSWPFTAMQPPQRCSLRRCAIQSHVNSTVVSQYRAHRFRHPELNPCMCRLRSSLVPILASVHLAVLYCAHLRRLPLFPSFLPFSIPHTGLPHHGVHAKCSMRWPFYKRPSSGVPTYHWQHVPVQAYS